MCVHIVLYKHSTAGNHDYVYMSSGLHPPTEAVCTHVLYKHSNDLKIASSFMLHALHHAHYYTQVTHVCFT